MAHNSGYQRQTIAVLNGDSMLKTVLSRPLGHAAGEIHIAAIYFPSLITKLDDDAHRAGADDSPLALGHIGNLHDLAVNQSSNCPDPNCIANPVNVSTQRRLPMVDILRRPKHLEIETGAPFAKTSIALRLSK